MRGYFHKNIDIEGKGGVSAADDAHMYYYHWERDGALTMTALLKTEGLQAREKFEHYIGWVKRVQAESDPNGVDVRIEPKYELPNGEVYTGAWGRPQTDGPPLRAVAIMTYVELLLENGEEAAARDLFNGPVARDIDWIMSGWDSNGFDLWEEVQSKDFFWNRMAFRHCLSKAAALSQRFGNSNSRYEQLAKQIEQSLQQHESTGYVYESTNREQDGAVIESFNKHYLGDGLYGPTSMAVARTVAQLTKTFCGIFPINQRNADAGLPGVLYGRYPGDTYFGGNPWILLSAALAETLYNIAADADQMSPEVRDAWRPLIGDTDDLKTAFIGAGDSVLNMVRNLVQGDDFHLAEQLDKNSGAQLSAQNLTWSYANVLTAMQAREKASRGAAIVYA